MPTTGCFRLNVTVLSLKIFKAESDAVSQIISNFVVRRENIIYSVIRMKVHAMTMSINILVLSIT